MEGRELIPALQQGGEAATQLQLNNQRTELERKIREQSKAAEDAAFRRVEEFLTPQVKALGEQLHAKVHAVGSRTEEAFPRIGDVEGAHNNTISELSPLRTRADVAASRIDRLSVQSATGTRDVAELRVDFDSLVCEFRGTVAEEKESRTRAEFRLESLLNGASDAAAMATRTVDEQSEQRRIRALATMTATEERLLTRMDEQGQRLLQESKRLNEELAAQLRGEILTVTGLVQRRCEEVAQQAEGLVQATQAQIRAEIESSAGGVEVACARSVEKKAAEIISKMTEGFEACHASRQSLAEAAEAQRQDSLRQLRQEQRDACRATSQEADGLRSQFEAAERHSLEASEAARKKAVDDGQRLLAEEAARLRDELSSAKRSASASEDTMRAEILRQLHQTATRIDAAIRDMGVQCDGSAGKALAQGMLSLRSELSDYSKHSVDLTEEVRCSCLRALSDQASSHIAALAAADAARDSLGANFRSELRSAVADVDARSRTLVAGCERRLDTADAKLESLQLDQEQVKKEHLDAVKAFRGDLQNERQQTEEGGKLVNDLINKVKDDSDAFIVNESTDLRTSLDECRQRFNTEAAGLRTELRQKAGRVEAQELQRDIQQRYNELSTSIGAQCKKLDAAMDDFALQSREVRNEATEARLKAQRETLALGHDLTNLRAASTSLANGVVKTAEVIGLLQSGEALESVQSQGHNQEEGSKRSWRTGVEVEDLLDWESAGNSLATRVSKTWLPKHAVGVSTLLALVEQKADEKELLVLNAVLRECALGGEAASKEWAPKPPVGVAPAKGRPQPSPSFGC